MPFACEEPPVGDVLKMFPRARFLYNLSAYAGVNTAVRCDMPFSRTHRFSRRELRSLRAACRPRGLLAVEHAVNEN